jgi:putative membrane protein
MRTTIAATILWTAVLALGPACKSNEKAPASNMTPASSSSKSAPTPTPEPAKPAAATLTDAQIAAIVVAANQVDIDAGKLAVEKSSNAEVTKFAQQMVTDHSAVNAAAVELVTRLKVTPEETDASRGLASSGTDTRTKLAALQGDAFDRAYVDNEVAYHQAVIGVLDSQLIPSATNEELKKTLVSVRPAFVAHLEHAQHLQTSLAGGHAPTM